MNTIWKMEKKSAEKYVNFFSCLLDQREVPPGLSKHDEKILRKLKKRAHTLDKGFNMCGLRFGWTFIIGLIPIAGDVTDALLSHHLIVKKAQKIEEYVLGLPKFN